MIGNSVGYFVGRRGDVAWCTGWPRAAGLAPSRPQPPAPTLSHPARKVAMAPRHFTAAERVADTCWGPVADRMVVY